MDKRFEQQMAFLLEADKLKDIFRQNLLSNGGRRENDAEHSWHIALMAMVLWEGPRDPEVDLLRVLKMLILHDLVEVYAGDTFAYDSAAQADKVMREQEAAKKLFSLLPLDQAEGFYQLWEEFDAQQTTDAQYASAMDRLQPLMLNHATKGYTWVQNKVGASQVLQRNQITQEALPIAQAYVHQVVSEGVAEGYLVEDR